MFYLRLFLAISCISLVATVGAETYDFRAVEEQYYKDHIGKGDHGDFWEPIPIQQYWNPIDFYEPPANPAVEVTRDQCVACHTAITRGHVYAWQNSVHANLDEIRGLSDDDTRAYKKKLIKEVEQNLRNIGLLDEGEQLSSVGCIDCHGGVGKQSIKHHVDLKLPDRAACGTCHLKEFAEAESEKEQEWPQDQWPKGHPSHSVDWNANVNTAIWAGMAQREIAQGCGMCHYNQNKCDGCHTRHTFSAAEARKPEACATCHNGVDHNEFENYMLSKHGVIYKTHGDDWDWEAPLSEALTKGKYTAPTCASCHFEFRNEFSHNTVRKVRWGFNPTPAIADNLSHPWFEERKDLWVATCSQCHSPKFSRTWLDTADKGTIQGLEVEQKGKKILDKLYEDGLLSTSNRTPPPEPEKDAHGGFFTLFWAEEDNPSLIDRTHAEMWEQDLIKHYKGLFHANPGGFTYTEGWSQLIRRYTEMQNESKRIREIDDLKKKVKSLMDK